MSNRDEKRKKIELLLIRMKTEPMNVHKMAEVLGMSSKSTSKYVTELRFFKKIHIHKYEKTIGQPAVFYMTGNLPDAPKPLAYSQAEYNRKYKLKIREPKARVPSKFTPRPDFAAAWLFNPINEKYDL